MKYRYFTCDVFTDKRFCGNQLAVLPHADGLSDGEMQTIAREFNFSETAFVFPPEKGHTRKVRIFTPTTEVPFAGHPNIGTAFVLTETGELGGEDVIVNDVEDDEDDNTCPPHALRVFPFKVSRDALERVMESMDLGDRVCLVDLLEDASVVIAPKSQVKTSTWLRHAARARGMPIYAVRADNSAQLVRALQAMLGITGASDGFNGGSGAQENRQRATTSSADETDALEEVRMAVEQLVIPHREPVELLPRSGRIIEMQQALVDTYMLSHSAVGEGTERRLRIEYEYKK